jgi:hypothetical protein
MSSFRSEIRSESERGDLLFAQSREAVHDDRPDRDLITREGLDLTDEVQRAQVALEECEEFGNAELVAKARARYDRAVSALREWEADGEGESERLPYFPLANALSKLHGAATDPDLDESDMKERLRTLDVLLRYVFQDGYANPWEGFKNFLAMTRRIKPEYLGAMTAEEVAWLLGETKASESAREIRVVEDKLRQWGVFGFHGLGGTKSEAARGNCAKAAKGNTNRRAGARRKKKAKNLRNGKVASAAARAARAVALPG